MCNCGRCDDCTAELDRERFDDAERHDGEDVDPDEEFRAKLAQWRAEGVPFHLPAGFKAVNK